MATNQATLVVDIIEELKQLREPLGITATQTTDAAGNILFSVSLNTNNLYSNFLGDNLSSIESVFEQLNPIIDLLTTEIPILSDIPALVDLNVGTLNFKYDSDNSSISVLDLIAFVGEYYKAPVDIGLINDIISITEFLTKIPSGEEIKLGQFKITPQGVFETISLA